MWSKFDQEKNKPTVKLPEVCTPISEMITILSVCLGLMFCMMQYHTKIKKSQCRNELLTVRHNLYIPQVKGSNFRGDLNKARTIWLVMRSQHVRPHVATGSMSNKTAHIWPLTSAGKISAGALKLHFPAEMSSNPNKTHLNKLIKLFRITRKLQCVRYTARAIPEHIQEGIVDQIRNKSARAHVQNIFMLRLTGWMPEMYFFWGGECFTLTSLNIT